MAVPTRLFEWISVDHTGRSGDFMSLFKSGVSVLPFNGGGIGSRSGSEGGYNNYGGMGVLSSFTPTKGPPLM